MEAQIEIAENCKHCLTEVRRKLTSVCIGIRSEKKANKRLRRNQKNKANKHQHRNQTNIIAFRDDIEYLSAWKHKKRLQNFAKFCKHCLTESEKKANKLLQRNQTNKENKHQHRKESKSTIYFDSNWFFDYLSYAIICWHTSMNRDHRKTRSVGGGRKENESAWVGGITFIVKDFKSCWFFDLLAQEHSRVQ